MLQSRFSQQQISTIAGDIMTLATLLISLFVFGSILVRATQGPLTIPASFTPLPESFQKAWGAYSPYFASGTYALPPVGCSVNQVNIVRLFGFGHDEVSRLNTQHQIQRHGARYPTDGAAAEMLAALKKLQSVKEYKSRDLDFLKSYSFDLGEDDMVPLGASQ